MPELILEAVTASASIKALHINGSVLWSADALSKLAHSLGASFAITANDPDIRKRFIEKLLEMVRDKKDYESEIAPTLILFALLIGTGIEFEK